MYVFLRIFLGLIIAQSLSCKTAKNASPIVSTPGPATTGTKDGAPTVGIAVNIDGTLWHAASYSIQQMGMFWVVKGLGEDNSVFSIMLPDPLATETYTVMQGGPVSITYSKAPGKGLTYLAPFSENDGWVKTTLADGYLRGNLEVTLNSGGEKKKCVGMFAVKL